MFKKFSLECLPALFFFRPYNTVCYHNSKSNCFLLVCLFVWYSNLSLYSIGRILHIYIIFHIDIVHIYYFYSLNIFSFSNMYSHHLFESFFFNLCEGTWNLFKYPSFLWEFFLFTFHFYNADPKTLHWVENSWEEHGKTEKAAHLWPEEPPSNFDLPLNVYASPNHSFLLPCLEN